MDDRDKIEGYLIALGYSFEKLNPDTWLINESEKGLINVLLFLESPILVVRVNVMSAPKVDREAFFLEVLKLNGSDLMHGAYAMDGEKLILLDTHLVETLDIEELQTTLDAFSLALFQHFQKLNIYRSKE